MREMEEKLKVYQCEREWDSERGVWACSINSDIIRKARAEAWDEGYTAGFYDREAITGDSRDASEGRGANPYRQEARDE